MITKVEVENFQSHKKTTLEFVPGTNVIIGLSDTGKSALFRAINWPITNRPLGDDFCSEWGGDTRVVLHTTEGNVVERIRSTSKNQYIVNGKVLEAFGMEVPEEVINILQLDSANIQSQMDPPFLLADTPGEAAKLLNKAASIDDIDIAIANLKSAYRKLDDSIKYSEKGLESQLAALKQYEDIPVIEEKLQVVEKLDEEWQTLLQNKERLASTVSQLLIVETELKSTENIPSLLEKQARIQKEYDTFLNKKKLQEQLQQIIQSVEYTQKKLSTTEYVEASIPLVQRVLDKYQEYQQKKQSVLNISRLVSNINIVKTQLKNVEGELETLEQEFHELSPEVCPLCGNVMRKKE